MVNSFRLLTDIEKNFVRECVEVVVANMRMFGFKDTGFSVKKTVDHWIYCCMMSESHPMAFVKHKMAAYYAAVKMQDERPESIWDVVDRPLVLVGGRAMRWVQKLERDSPSIFEVYYTTIQYLKKGMPRPDDAMLREAEEKTFKTLTTIPKPTVTVMLEPWGVENDLKVSKIVSRDRIEGEIRRMCNDTFGGMVYTDEDRTRAFVPSTSASYINSRSKGGVIGQLLGEHSDLLDGLMTDEDLILLDKVLVGKESFEQEVERNVFNLRSTEQVLLTVDYSPLNVRFIELYNRICYRALHYEAPRVKLLALAEALKTRVISKGPGLLYTALKPLQKALWRKLSSHPTFRLTGEPVSSEILQEIIGATLKDDEAFLSVDYRDATNLIQGWASECAMYEIAKILNLPDVERKMAIRSLTGHIIEFGDLEAFQENGQLMGGILSFIILCVINAAILRMTKEMTDQRRYTLRDVGIAVNGDDGLMKTTVEGRKIWKVIGAAVGLHPSVGKVYYSRQFLNINSTTYNFHPYNRETGVGGWEAFRIERVIKDKPVISTRVICFELVKYVNVGLLYSLKRSGGTIDSTEVDRDNLTFGARAHALIDACPSFLRERVMGQFLHLNRDKIKIDLPYFIPENMGGLGLPAVGRYTSSNSDLRFARLIFENPKRFKMPPRPADVDWKFWEYATKRFPTSIANVATDFEQTPGMSSLSTIRGKACVEALFRLKDIKQFMNDVHDDNALKHYQQSCRRVWSRARKVTNPPEPYVQGKFPTIHNINDRPLFHNIG